MLRSIPRRSLALGLVASLFFCGCSEELGPVHFETTTVTGVVRSGQRLIPGGWIEFFPVDGTIGNLRSGRIGRDGSFKVDGVAVGRQLVRLINIKLERPDIDRLFSTTQLTPIRRVIVKDSKTPLTIDVLEELYQFQQQRERSTARSLEKTGKTQQ
jgi:hypothetical protein